MKNINQSLLLQIKEFIDNYQIKNGKSPTFRCIKDKLNLNSLSQVNRYISLLEQQGHVKKNPLGGIDMSCNLSLTTYAPLVGQVRCGTPIFAQENYQTICSLPKEIFGNGELFMLTAIGDSMENAGIRDGDILVVRRSAEAENGQIVVALIEENATVKRLKKNGSKIYLHPENPKYKDIISENIQILGIVQSYIHRF